MWTDRVPKLKIRENIIIKEDYSVHGRILMKKDFKVKEDPYKSLFPETWVKMVSVFCFKKVKGGQIDAHQYLLVKLKNTEEYNK